MTSQFNADSASWGVSATYKSSALLANLSTCLRRVSPHIRHLFWVPSGLAVLPNLVYCLHLPRRTSLLLLEVEQILAVLSLTNIRLAAARQRGVPPPLVEWY